MLFLSSNRALSVAERVGFEPTVRLHVRLISSQILFNNDSSKVAPMLGISMRIERMKRI